MGADLLTRRLTLPLAAIAAVAVVTAGCAGGGEHGVATETAAATETAPKGPTPATSLGALESGIVARVNDGDTITLRDGRRIRLVQIDAPELNDECYGQGARRRAEKLMPPGTRVTLRRDPNLDDRDDYGRYLRYVEANAHNVNAELVVFGAAVPYFFRGERGRYASDLLIAVEEARAKDVGLWEACPNAKLNTGLGSLTGPS